MAINFVLVGTLLFDILTDAHLSHSLVLLIEELTHGAHSSHDELSKVKKMTENLITRKHALAVDLLDELATRQLTEAIYLQKVEKITELFQESYHGFEKLHDLQEFQAESAAYCAILFSILKDRTSALKWIDRAINAYTPISLMVYDPNNEWYNSYNLMIAEGRSRSEQLEKKENLTPWETVDHLSIKINLVAETVTEKVEEKVDKFFGDSFVSFYARVATGMIVPSKGEQRLRKAAQKAKAWFTGDPHPEEQEEINRQLVAAKASQARSAIEELAKIKLLFDA